MYQACLVTPFVSFGIRCSESAVSEITFLPADAAAIVPAGGLALTAWRQLEQYLIDPLHAFDLPLAIAGTPFQRRVWAEIQRIPVGETITYAELARRVGSGPRAVANACGANALPIVIPCHRVVGTAGVGGFMRGRRMDALDLKRWLLSHERNAPGTA
jgi:methylated-DNA-[protein]-cysteine S-methyltransferase